MISSSRAGDCYDNAVAESFFATRKAELIDTQAWPTRAVARSAIVALARRHSALGYRHPVAYKEEHLLLSSDRAAWCHTVRRNGPTSGSITCCEGVL